MKKELKKGLIVFIFILPAIIVPFVVKTKVETIKARYTEFEDKVEFKGLYFAQENVLYKGDTKGLQIKYKKGERIPKGAVLSNGITAPQPGILSTLIDGFENKYDINNIKEIKMSDINDIINNLKEMPGIKIINNSELFLCINVKDSTKLKKGKQVDIIINSIYYRTEIMDVFKNNDETFAVLRVKDDIEIGSLHRGLKGYIINARYNGIVVPDESIAEVNGTPGVFVKSGDYAEFRAVDVLFRGKGAAVVVPAPKAKKQLEEYDDIICNAQGLYDGEKVK